MVLQGARPMILDEILNEMRRAHALHGDNSLYINQTLGHRLAVLGEEFGEVCRANTYDGKNRDELRKELIQLAAMSASWADSLNGHLYP